MKLCRYDDNRIGVVRNDRVHDVSSIVQSLPSVGYPFPLGDQLVAHLDTLRPDIERLADKAKPLPVEDVRFLSPVANPTKIIGTPVNYEDHAAEARADAVISLAHAEHGGKQRKIEEAGLFLKASSSLVGPSEGVVIRFPERRTDHEAELGLVIGRRVSNISEQEALSAVAGYAIALDMVVRGTEDRSFRKSCDTFSVLGPWLVTADELGDPGSLSFSLSVNGEPRQNANTRNMIVGVARQIAWASSMYTLYPGDIIMTGTPAGVGPVRAGDTMTVTFDRIGSMQVPVRAA
ncbi:MAG TPA: fumarylacetoacetate hydrolase family protein [Beijerinckiaceae bacterium]|nr:fumarylacetoacetate hydrolase family protein [Beijerinckiaceae bacterium]